MSDSDPYPMSRVKPEDTAMEIKCVVTTPILRFLDSHFGEAQANRMVSETEMNVGYLRDADHWISFDYFCRLLRKLVDVTGNPRAPLVAAQEHSDMSTYGLVARFLKHLGSPRQSYHLVVQFHSLWNKISTWRLVEVGRTRCVMSVRMLGRKQDRNNCLAIQGSLATIPSQYGLPSARVVERRCACDGADACEYEIRWVSRPSRLWAVAGALGGLSAGSLAAVLADWMPGSGGCVVLLSAAGYFAGRAADYKIRLSDVYVENERQASSLLGSIRAIEELNEGLQKKVEERTEQVLETNRHLTDAMRSLQESQEKIIMAERQAAVGVLAAGMAHEMNNPMNAVRLSLQALRESVAEGSELARVVDVAERATGRCTRIVSDLLSFSREPQQLVPVKLRDILSETVAEFLRDHPADFRIETEIASSPLEIRLDRAQIKQALGNILANAYDAMEGKGVVEVRLRCEGNDAVLSITDHGPGIDESLHHRVFDPFFTTKKSAARKGTGLGLSIAYQLLQRNRGSLELQSKKGCGATFIIRFALQDSAVRSTGEESHE